MLPVAPPKTSPRPCQQHCSFRKMRLNPVVLRHLQTQMQGHAGAEQKTPYPCGLRGNRGASMWYCLLAELRQTRRRRSSIGWSQLPLLLMGGAAVIALQLVNANRSHHKRRHRCCSLPRASPQSLHSKLYRRYDRNWVSSFQLTRRQSGAARGARDHSPASRLAARGRGRPAGTAEGP